MLRLTPAVWLSRFSVTPWTYSAAPRLLVSNGTGKPQAAFVTPGNSRTPLRSSAEVVARARRVVPERFRIRGNHHPVGRLEAQCDLTGGVQAAREQCAGDQQDHRERDLGSDQDIAQLEAAAA